ncbi:AAA family ATPase [Streptomyces griseus]|uniref:AAA family ATPase n=1 Tax=Streptomyces griseus TaxID=1911 RepID=UPI0033F40FD3
MAEAIARDAEEQRAAAQAKHEKEKALARKKGLEAAEAEAESLRVIESTRGSQIAVKRTLWLWKERFPLGGLALVAGKGDVSKSTLFAQFVAWITTGDMHGDLGGVPRDIGYVVNEDSLSQTVAPRMIAHGADMDRVHFLKVRSPLGTDALMFPRDVELLRKFIQDNHLVAVFIDPLSANVSGRKNDQGDMRATYQEVNNLAEETNTSIIGLAHTRKAGAADIMEAIIGSSEQGNVARSVHGLVMDPEEDGARILSCEKLNVGQKDKLPSLRFTLRTVLVPCTDGSGLSTPMPQIQWLEEITDTASDIMADALLGHSGTDECVRWLRRFITDQGGESFHADIRESAGRKFSESMMVRARRKAGVKTRRTKESPSRSVWYIEDYVRPDTRGDESPGPIYTQTEVN